MSNAARGSCRAWPSRRCPPREAARPRRPAPCGPWEAPLQGRPQTARRNHPSVRCAALGRSEASPVRPQQAAGHRQPPTGSDRRPLPVAGLLLPVPCPHTSRSWVSVGYQDGRSLAAHSRDQRPDLALKEEMSGHRADRARPGRCFRAAGMATKSCIASLVRADGTKAVPVASRSHDEHRHRENLGPEYAQGAGEHRVDGGQLLVLPAKENQPDARLGEKTAADSVA